MSGIAAVIRFDGGPVEPGTVEAMTAAMHYRGVDGIAHWSDGQAALGHCMLHTTAESLEEKQPLASEDGNRVLVFHGWLSNPEEVRSDLLARGVRLRDRSDAELVLRAYEVWGDDCPQRIDGEFAFLVWDKVRQEAFLARDHMGLTSLHYCWDGKRLVVATDIVGVLAVPGIEAVPNRGKIAEYIICEFTEAEETIWQGVMNAPPAHWMRFGRSGVRRGKYWQPPLEITIRYPRDEDYFEHYRELLADCVRRASRTHLPLACDVSGGLDSSAIFAMAHDLSRKDRLLAPEVKGYTYLFEDALGTPADEIEFARAVARHVQASVREVAPFLPETEWFTKRGKLDRDFCGYPNGAMAVSIGEALISDGCRVTLNGEGGDNWLCASPFYMSELIDDRNWNVLFEEFRHSVERTGLWSAAWNLFRFGLAHRLPTFLLNARRTTLQRLKQPAARRKDGLSEELGRLLDRRKYLGHFNETKRVRNISRRVQQMSLSDPYSNAVRGLTPRLLARLGCTMRSPMQARSFIEFAFATPERIRFRSGINKYAHRRAMRDLLPPLVANRISKAHFAITAERHFMGANSQSIMQALENDQNGFLDSKVAAHLLEQYRKNPHHHGLIWPLWGMVAIGSLF
jgi:asparagine synthase (glutamine-hydrolysing)